MPRGCGARRAHLSADGVGPEAPQAVQAQEVAFLFVVLRDLTANHSI